MTRDYLKLLVDYHYWARDRVLSALEPLSPEQYGRDLGSSFASARDTANHLFFAEWIWYERWMGASPTAADPKPDIADFAALRRMWAAQETRVRSLVDGLDDAGVDRLYEYRMLSGAEAKSRFWEMLVHVVNHASYHRGQLTTLIRQAGGKPPESMDMITFFRTGS